MSFSVFWSFLPQSIHFHSLWLYLTLSNIPTLPLAADPLIRLSRVFPNPIFSAVTLPFCLLYVSYLLLGTSPYCLPRISTFPLFLPSYFRLVFLLAFLLFFFVYIFPISLHIQFLLSSTLPFPSSSLNLLILPSPPLYLFHSAVWFGLPGRLAVQLSRLPDHR